MRSHCREEASKHLEMLYQETPQHEPLSLCCMLHFVALLVAGGSLWNTPHKLPQTVLSEPTSKDGDWFLDELLTMSDSMSHIIEIFKRRRCAAGQRPLLYHQHRQHCTWSLQ